MIPPVPPPPPRPAAPRVPGLPRGRFRHTENLAVDPLSAGAEPTPKTRLVSPPNLAAVLAALEAEADTLHHAAAAAGLADTTLQQAADHTRAADALADRLRHPSFHPAGLRRRAAHDLKQTLHDHRQAVTRLTSAAAYRGVPLFDGRYRLQLAGGKLALPDLVRSRPTRHALATLRGQVQEFRHRVVADRLEVVRATLQQTAHTAAVLQQNPTAVSPATLQGYPALAVGRLLDIRA